MELKIKSILKPKLGILLIVLSIISLSSVTAQSSGGVINLGLYGGASTDFAWAYSSNRLFSGVETPASLYWTDDYCLSWTKAFPIDSLEYTTDSYRRGWGGGATRVLSNLNGWVGVQTAEQGGTLTSAVISFNNGDYGSFETAFDGYRLKHLDNSYGRRNTTAIGMSDYWFYIGLEEALTRIYDGYTIGTSTIVLDMTSVGVNTRINWIAVPNTVSGYPVLLVANVPGNQYGKLYSFDGTTVTEITGTGILPTYGFERIFVHPAETTANTLIASVVLKAGNTRKLYLSSDGGSTWTDITPGGFETDFALEDADYSPDWVASMPISNGLILSYPGVEQSDDLGATWSSHMLPDNATATHPSDLNYVVGSKNDGPKLSSTGEEGTFNDVDNEGHAAVSMTKISHKSNDVYYIASKAGLGYTDAYMDPTVVGVDQWVAPHGDFPISGVGTDSGVSSVAVDPSDENHVIAGGTDGFYITTTGPTGFSHYQPSGWDSGSQLDYSVTDIKFVTSSIVVAVTGTGSNRLPDPTASYGNIWVSTTGGTGGWTKITPTDVDGTGATVEFDQGKSLVVGFGTTTTVIYAATGYYDATDPGSGGQLWKSEDNGVTWSFINYGPTGAMSGTARMPIYDIDIHPNADSTDVLYIASGHNTDYGFCRTADGGLTYDHLNVLPEGNFSSVLVNVSTPMIVSVAARNNLYRYDVSLASSTLVYEGLPGEFIPDLETGSTLLATNTGFYKLSEELGGVTTKWNGDGEWNEVSKWSNGVPYEICTTVVESGTLDVNMDGKAHAISVSPGAALTVSASQSLTLTGDLTLNSDETGYASFIDDGSISVDGDIKVERYITADQWHYITSPISDAKADVFDGLYLGYYDESTSTWEEVMSPTEDLLAGQGYKTWAWETVTGDATLEFTGTLNTGDFSPSITLSGDPSETGWNMVGNNFPSAIDWGTDNDPVLGYALTNIDNTLYFWNNNQYATYNPSGDGVATNGGTQYIASMQAFFVHANAASPAITIPQESRLHHTQGFRNEKINTSALSLKVSSTNYSDEIIIIPNSIATIDFDNKYDAYKLFGSDMAPQFYSIMENEILSVNNLPLSDDVIHQPLGFVPGSSENHTIEVGGIENFANGIIITLEDLKEEKIIDLKFESSYTFYADVNDDLNRFILHIDATASGVNSLNPLDALIFSSKGNIIILEKQGSILKGYVKVFDVLGKLHYEQELKGDSKEIINPKLNTGTYIVEICCNNSIQTQKVFIE